MGRNSAPLPQGDNLSLSPPKPPPHTCTHRLKEHLDAGAPINSPDLCGDPPLLLAAGGGQLAAVKLLVEEGADLEIRNVMKETPLIRAAHNGTYITAQLSSLS